MQGRYAGRGHAAALCTGLLGNPGKVHTGNQLLQCINPLRFPLSPPLFTQFALTFGSACLTKYPMFPHVDAHIKSCLPGA